MVKVISIADDVYKELKKRKGKKSFSELLRDMMGNNVEEVLACAGKGGVDEEAVKEAQKGWETWARKYL